jgi:hypothetical protein
LLDWTFRFPLDADSRCTAAVYQGLEGTTGAEAPLVGGVAGALCEPVSCFSPPISILSPAFIKANKDTAAKITKATASFHMIYFSFHSKT